MSQLCPKFDIPFSVFPAVQYFAIFICDAVYYKLFLILCEPDGDLSQVRVLPTGIPIRRQSNGHLYVGWFSRLRGVPPSRVTLRS